MTASSVPSKSFGSSVALCLLLFATAPRAQVEWVDLGPALQPNGASTMAFDEARGHILRYGGRKPVWPYGPTQTWTWDGTVWTQLSPAVDPGQLTNGVLVFDGARQQTVMFGGSRTSGSEWEPYVAETWVWDGTTWTEQFPATAPPPRRDHALAYDVARGRVVLFGGDVDGTLGNDTWEYDGITWTQRSTAQSPPARQYHVMTYDSVRQRVVLFGGRASTGKLSDTWEYDGSTWVQRAPTTAPESYTYASMTFDTARQRTLLLAGRNGAGFEETWEWNGSEWMEHSPANPPPYQTRGTLCYDSVRQQVIASTGGGQTWVWDGANWTPRLRNENVAHTMDHSMAYDEARQEIVVFGGGERDITNPVRPYLNTTWLWDSIQWRRAQPATSPPPRGLAAMVYDAARKRVVLFGGVYKFSTIGPVRNDTWEWDGRNWTQRNPSVSPPPRFGHAMAYDTDRGITLMFGGRDLNTIFRDTWLWDGQTWTELVLPAKPPARSGHTMAYDAGRRAVVLHGGNDQTSIYRPGLRGDTWEFDGTYWWWRTFNATPPQLRHSAMVYDAARQRTVLYGGFAGFGINSSATDRTWEWIDQAWVERTQPGTTTRVGRGLVVGRHAMAYDTTRRRTVQFGGTIINYPFDELWEYGPTNPGEFAAFGQGCAGSAGTPELVARNGSLPWVGATFEYEVTNLVPNRPAWVFVGVSNTSWGAITLPLSLSFLGLAPCEILVSGEIVVPRLSLGGVASGSLNVPNVSALAGQVLYLQGLAADPVVGLTVSNAAALTFGIK